MKKYFIIAIMAFAAAAACNKVVVNEQPAVKEDLTGHYVTKTVTLGNETKATASFADEAKINDATVFVYQKNNETGTVIDYDVKYVTGNTVDFDLYFSDQTVYTYTFAAWVNMGELTDEPVAGDIFFADEKSDDLMMRGKTEDVAEADAEAVTVPVTRYVGKVMVADIKLDWKHKMNALKKFELIDIYVANAGDSDAATPVAAYNLDGAYVSSAMDGFLYDSMASFELADGATYDQDHVFYAYDAASTEIVIKAELDDEVMYYHFPIAPADNTYKSYSITIKQIGAEDPLGELPEETIVVSTVTLTVEGWNNQADGEIVFEK